MLCQTGLLPVLYKPKTAICNMISLLRYCIYTSQ
nr:MAG TPA: hypothetical protein [Caudoviricetes sp.]